MNLGKNTKVTKILAGAGSATSTLTSTAVDMQGFEGVLFVGPSVATVNAGNYAKVQQSSDDGVADAYADLAGTKLVPGDNADSALIDINRPRERYVKLVVVRTAATVTGDVYAVQYGPRDLPTSHGATMDAETFASPAEGTA